MEENKEFKYTYSAREQAEIRHIREKYTKPPCDEDKLARLRRLDASVTGRAQAVSLIFGVVGMLILGLGMSLVMTDFGEIVGGGVVAMLIGVTVGIVGGVFASLAYPIYARIVSSRKSKLAPEILRLTDELMK